MQSPAISILRKGVFRRVAVVSLTAISLILLAPIVAQATWPVFFLLGLIPTLALLVLTIIVAAITVFESRQTKFEIAAFLSLLISQAIIIIAWLMGWTAESIFERQSQDIPLPTGLPILDPGLNSLLMKLFWLGAALVLALMIESLINHLVSREPGFTKKLNGRLVVLLLFEGFILVSLQFSHVNFLQRSTRSTVSGKSPEVSREIRLVPMQAFLDVNGLVISRKPGALVWRTVGRVGDLLTESHGERFAWADHDSKAYLLLQLHEDEIPVLGFDFAINQSIDPRSYQEESPKLRTK